jgi:hypothetical protein
VIEEPERSLLADAEAAPPLHGVRGVQEIKEFLTLAT